MRMGVLWGAGFLYSMGSRSWQKGYKTKVPNDIRRKNTTHFFMHR